MNRLSILIFLLLTANATVRAAESPLALDGLPGSEPGKKVAEGVSATTSNSAIRPPVRDTDRVLVVRNENSPVSRAVADDYAQRRRNERLFRAMPG